MVGRWRKIHWTGEGSNPSGLHTKQEFLQRMRTQYWDHVYRRRRGDKEVPFGNIKRTDIDGWMEFANAKYV